MGGSVQNHMPTMPTYLRLGNRPNPGNQNERPHQPQFPANSHGRPLSKSWHIINKNNVEVLAREEGWFKRKVHETVEIKTILPTINRDQGFDHPAIYNEILPVTRDCSRQTSDHSALTIVAVAGRSLAK